MPICQYANTSILILFCYRACWCLWGIRGLGRLLHLHLFRYLTVVSIISLSSSSSTSSSSSCTLPYLTVHYYIVNVPTRHTASSHPRTSICETAKRIPLPWINIRWLDGYLGRIKSDGRRIPGSHSHRATLSPFKDETSNQRQEAIRPCMPISISRS